MKQLKHKIIICATVLLIFSSGAFAMGVSPYLPLNMTPEIERKIERLMILAGRPVMTRPIALATVLEALSDARKADEDLCSQVERYLERYMPEAGLTQLRVELGLDSGESEQVLPNQYGQKVDNTWKISGAAHLRLGDYIAFNLGGIAYQDRINPTGTMLSLGIDYAQLDIGYRPHWLSPFTDSSMLISTEAPTMPSITLSNYRPISALGITYEMYLAEMSKSDRITYNNGYTTGHPRLGGVHLQMQPVTGYSFAVNRQFQFGGGARKNDSLRDFIKAFINYSKYDTISSMNNDMEFGNEEASITSRIVFPGKHPFAVYFEYAGEDSSDFGSYMLGCTSFSLGVDFARLWNNFNFSYEGSEWQNAWYVHHLYQDGMTNESIVTGHWFGDQRQFNNAAGGISHMVRLGWDAGEGAHLQGIYRTLVNNSYTTINYKRMQEFGLSYSRPWHGQIVGLEIYSGRDVFGMSYARMSATMNFGQSWLSQSEVESIAANAKNETELFMDAGAGYNKFRTNLQQQQDGTLARQSSNGTDLHLAFGARHSVSKNNDLGTRIEWDRVAGNDLYSLRMLDYRYRIGTHFALTGFFGVGRYSLHPPAYGYYFGAGLQFLDLLPEWDACLDVSNRQRMARRKEFSGNNENLQYNVKSITVYLSRHF